MAVVYSENIIEIAVVQDFAGKPAVNVVHMWFDSELGTDTMEDVVGDFRDNWQDHMMDLQVATASIIRFDWRSLDPSDSSVGTIQPDSAKALVGQRAGLAGTPNQAYLIHKNTDSRPRGRRDGRIYLAGVGEGDVESSGLIDAGFVTLANTALASFYNGISDTSGSASGDRYPAVLETTPASRTPGTQTVTIGSRRITSFTIDPLLATQRDRLR